MRSETRRELRRQASPQKEVSSARLGVRNEGSNRLATSWRRESLCPSEMEGDVFPTEALDPEFGELMQRTFQAACLCCSGRARSPTSQTLSVAGCGGRA